MTDHLGCSGQVSTIIQYRRPALGSISTQRERDSHRTHVPSEGLSANLIACQLDKTQSRMPSAKYLMAHVVRWGYASKLRSRDSAIFQSHPVITMAMQAQQSMLGRFTDTLGGASRRLRISVLINADPKLVDVALPAF